jgi:glycosyltransferase involved in cell wall biosynthesis
MLGRGHRVTLVTSPGTPIALAAARLQVPLVPVAIPSKRIGSLRSLRRWLASERSSIDLLNTHSSTDSWLAAVACTTMRNAPPIVRTRHVSTTVNNRLTTRWLYRHATTHIVTTGHNLKQQLVHDNRVAPEHITSVPTGIDLCRFVPGDAYAARARLGLQQRPTLGIVATLRDWKGHDFLFEAIALDRQGWLAWDLIVVGDGPHRENLEAHVAALRLGDQVRFVGQQDDVVPWLHALDLFTLPSFGEEGAPQALMQAMACNVPVVSTPVGAIPEVIEHEVTGLLAVPRSPPALSAALARLRDDQELRTRLAAQGLARARRDFGINLMLDRMEAVFRRVLESN